MFVSHERNGAKKKFQKPNILRRKPKVPVKPNVSEACESVNVNSLVTTSPLQDTISSIQLNSITKHSNVKPAPKLRTSMQRQGTEKSSSERKMDVDDIDIKFNKGDVIIDGSNLLLNIVNSKFEMCFLA